MNTATNKASIEWWDKNCCASERCTFFKKIFMEGEILKFLAVGWYSAQCLGIPIKV